MNSLVLQRPYLSLFILALAVRVLNLAAISYSESGVLVEDDYFWTFGKQWAIALGFLPGEITSSAYVERVPLYPVFVALMDHIGLGSPWAVAFFNCVFDAMTCVLVAKIAAELDRSVALLAGLLSALWPNLIIHSAMVLGDTVFVLFLLLTLLGALKFTKHPDIKSACIFGILLGLTILIRPVAQFLVFPMLIVMGVVVWRYHASALKLVLIPAIFLFAISSTTAVVFVHNFIHFDRLALGSQAGAHLAFWVVPSVKEAEDGTERSATVARLQEDFKTRSATHTDRENMSNVFVRNDILTEIALRELSDASPLAIAKAWSKGIVLNLFTPAVLLDNRMRDAASASFIDSRASSFAEKVWNYVSGNGALYFTIFVLGAAGSVVTSLLVVVGILAASRSHTWPLILGLLLICYFLLVNGPVGSPKYRLPFEPVLIILTAFGIRDIYRRYTRSN